MYAIFETGGKQYKVQKGDVVFIEKIDVAEGETVVFDKVLYTSNGKTTKVGTPYTTSVVGAKVLKQGKDKKITVFTYKPKKNEKRKLGHSLIQRLKSLQSVQRLPLTRLSAVLK